MAAGLVFFLGFGALAALWWLFEWKRTPGLFDYRSATLGYGLLLPVLVGALVAALRRLEPQREDVDRRIGSAAAVVGAVVALAIQALWFTDPHPEPNWSFPKAHHFNAAGIYNALLLITAFVVTTGASAVVLVRLRRLRRRGGEVLDAVSKEGLAIFVACSVALTGFVVLDNSRASDTQAGLATTVAVIAAVGVIVLALGIAFGRQLRKYRPGLLWGGTGGLGAAALSQYGLDASGGIAAAAVVTAILGGVASSQPLARAAQLERAVAATAAVLGLAGTLAEAIHLAPDHGTAAFVVVVVGVLLATAAGSADIPLTKAAGLRALAALYCVATLGWAAWVDATQAPSNARAAFNAVAVLFEILVLVLIRERLRHLVTQEEEAAMGEGQHASGKRVAPGYAAWIEFVGYAVPAVLAALVFLSVSSPLLESGDVAAGSATKPTDLLLPVGAIAIAMGAGAAFIALAHRKETRPPLSVDEPLDIPLASVALVALGAVAFLAVESLELDQPTRLVGLAALSSLIYCALCVEDLRASAARIQLMNLGGRGWMIAMAAGIAQAMTLFWLVAVGLWHNGEPASVGSMVVTTLVALGIGFAIHAMAGLSLAWSVPGDPLTAEPPALNVSMIAVLYLALAVLATATPVFVIGRVDAAGELANSGTVVLGSVFIAPSCAAAYAWILIQNFKHVERERDMPIRIAVAKLRSGESVVPAPNDLKLDRMREHVVSQLVLTLALVGTGMGYAAYTAIF